MGLSSDKISDLLIKRLQKLIADRQLDAGMRLPSERTLAAELHVSRASVREALQKLNSRGVLSTRPGGGSYLCRALSPWSAPDIDSPLTAAPTEAAQSQADILEARQTLEAGTAWYAALRATAEDKQRLQYCFDVLCELQSEGDAGLIARADARFHLMIAEASHNAVLLSTMRGLFALLHSSVLQTHQQMFTDQQVIHQLSDHHQRLLQAILQGDAPAARDAALAHLNFVCHTHRHSENETSEPQVNLLLPGALLTRESDL